MQVPITKQDIQSDAFKTLFNDALVNGVIVRVRDADALSRCKACVWSHMLTLYGFELPGYFSLSPIEYCCSQLSAQQLADMHSAITAIFFAVMRVFYESAGSAIFQDLVLPDHLWFLRAAPELPPLFLTPLPCNISRCSDSGSLRQHNTHTARMELAKLCEAEVEETLDFLRADIQYDTLQHLVMHVMRNQFNHCWSLVGTCGVVGLRETLARSRTLSDDGPRALDTSDCPFGDHICSHLALAWLGSEIRKHTTVEHIWMHTVGTVAMQQCYPNKGISLHAYIYVCVRTCVRTHVCTYVLRNSFHTMYVRVYVPARTYVRTQVCTVRTYMLAYARTYVHVCMCTCVCTYTYVHA